MYHWQKKHGGKYMNGIKTLLDSICLLSETYRKMEYTKGESYNLFRVIDMTSNETSVHSALLADLLSPIGLHGMGDVFLKLFIEQMGLCIDFNTANARVEREKHLGTVTGTSGGRLDIIVDDLAGKGIIIENKIYAADQENQIIRYHNYALDRYKSGANYKLLYLSLDGEVHDEEKTASGLERGEHYHTISYGRDILEWLGRCREKAADKPLIREGISHYANLIKYLTGQTLSEDMEKDMQDLILNNPDYIRNIRVIKNAVELVEIKLQENFWQELKEQMERAGYKVAPEPKGSSNYYNALEKDRIRNFYKKSKDCLYGFEFKVGDYKGSTIYYAFRKHQPLICGFLARKDKRQDGLAVRKPITDYSEYSSLLHACRDLSAYTQESKGWYLLYKTVEPEMDFKRLDDATLDGLMDMKATVGKIVDAAVKDIECMQEKIKSLSC